MPQKKNPGCAGADPRQGGDSVCADATALFMTMKGLPLAYNKDMQETQQPVFAAAQQVPSMLRVATGFMATVDVRLRAHAGGGNSRLHECAGGGCVSGAAGRAVPPAHELIGKAVRLCVEKGCELEQLSEEDYAICGIDGGRGVLRRAVRWSKFWPSTTCREVPLRRGFGRR